MGALVFALAGLFPLLIGARFLQNVLPYGQFADLLSGGLSGGGCTRPGVTVMANTMTSLAIDPTPFTDRDAYIAEITRYLDWVKGSPPSQPGGEVLLPGEVEHRTRAERLAKGVPLDEASWKQIVDAAGTVGIDEAETRRLAGLA